MNKRIFGAFINLLYPANCLICRHPLGLEHSKPVCAACWNKIAKNEPPYCPKCGRSVKDASDAPLLCGACADAQFQFERAWSVCLYEGIIKECLHLLKYSRKLSLVKPLAELMADFFAKYMSNSFDIIVPVPLHSARRRQREFNQSKLLADYMGIKANLPVMPRILKRVRNTVSQINLSVQERLANVKGAFQGSEAAYKKSVLIIDDVFTTGSTVNECAHALRQCGAKKIEVLTLARGR